MINVNIKDPVNLSLTVIPFVLHISKKSQFFIPRIY